MYADDLSMYFIKLHDIYYSVLPTFDTKLQSHGQFYFCYVISLECLVNCVNRITTRRYGNRSDIVTQLTRHDTNSSTNTICIYC